MENTKNITITNSTVNFYDRDLAAEARDELLRRLFYARHKDTKSIKGLGGATRSACLKLINIITNTKEVN